MAKDAQDAASLSVFSTSAGTPWRGFTVEHYLIKSGFCTENICLDRMLLSFVMGGITRLGWRDGHQECRRTCQYGQFTFLAKEYEIANINIDGDNQALAIQIDSPIFQSSMQNDPFGQASLVTALPPHFYGDDKRLFNIALVMRDEIARGAPSGKIFAESISLALLSCLVATHQNAQPVQPKRISGLSFAKLKLLEEYIQTNLANDISLGHLASLVRLSPRHLCRSFSEATGLPPHRYVLHARINRAKVLLKLARSSITDIAFELGFASPSHFSVAFRKVTGMSPKQFLQFQ